MLHTNEILTYVSSVSEKVGHITATVNDVMEYDTPYTAAARLEKLGLKSKETFRRNYLHPSIKRNLIRMTVPDKSNSKNQRYIKL